MTPKDLTGRRLLVKGFGEVGYRCKFWSSHSFNVRSPLDRQRFLGA